RAAAPAWSRTRLILGYSARLDPARLGYGLRAIARVNLSTHNEKTDESFASFLTRHDEVREAYSVSGDADYVLIIVTRHLAAFADFIHLNLPAASAGRPGPLRDLPADDEVGPGTADPLNGPPIDRKPFNGRRGVRAGRRRGGARRRERSGSPSPGRAASASG
ncbi:MAG: Lrp/AsnC family transcriptional regulator, partial [Methylobacterium frigidaeris]